MMAMQQPQMTKINGTKTKLSVNVDDGKKMKQTVLVKGTSIENALSVLKLKMKDTLADWDSISITETDIYEVILK